jgi:hypothetical protein
VCEKHRQPLTKLTGGLRYKLETSAGEGRELLLHFYRRKDDEPANRQAAEPIERVAQKGSGHACAEIEIGASKPGFCRSRRRPLGEYAKDWQ